MTPTDRNAEARIQRAILEYIWAAYPDVICAAVPNGGFVLDKRVVARLKWLGLLPGFPDLILIWTGGFALVEVKQPSGVLSDSQRALIPLLRSRGTRVAIWRSVQDADDGLRAWGVTSRLTAA